MAFFTDSLRGDGLIGTQRALAGLVGDPQRLDRARTRFDYSPPPYTSDRSGTTTLSQSPNPPSEEQRRLHQRRRQLLEKRKASTPYEQFSNQIDEERKRVLAADLNRTHYMPIGQNLLTIARENVKKRWVEQGIWNSKWDHTADGRWKHEEPLELKSELETDSEAGPSPRFSFFPEPQSKPRQPKNEDKKRRNAERRVIREREREASRPYHQFVYQISKERERIQDEFVNGEGTSAADINTTAYENVKNTWTKPGIWNKKWRILPGMTWKHEEPLEEDDPAPVPVNPLVNGSHGVGKAPAICLSGLPSPVESNHRQASALKFIPARTARSDYLNRIREWRRRTLSLSAEFTPCLGKWGLRPSTGQTLLTSKRKAFKKYGQSTSASLGPVHSSKVLKAAGKRRVP